MMFQSSEFGDDHDYGLNDGGKEFKARKESKDELFEFLEIPQDHASRKRNGIYQSYIFGGWRKEDENYPFRYPGIFETLWQRILILTTDIFLIKRGLMLGKAQWKWLSKGTI